MYFKLQSCGNRRGSFSFLLSSFSFPSFLYHQGLSLQGIEFISVFPPKLTKADHDSFLVSVGGWEQGTPFFLDALGHGPCLLYEGGQAGRPQLSCSSIYFFIALIILCSCPPQRKQETMPELCIFCVPLCARVFAQCLAHRRNSINEG